MARRRPTAVAALVAAAAALLLLQLLSHSALAAHSSASASASLAAGGVEDVVKDADQSNGNEQVFDNANDDGTGTTVVLSNDNKVHTLNSKFAIKEEQSKQRVKMEAAEKKAALDSESKREEMRVKLDNKKIADQGRANEMRLKGETKKFQETLEGREKAAARANQAAKERAARQHAARMAKHRQQAEQRAKQLQSRTKWLAKAHAAMKAAGGGDTQLTRAWRAYGGGWQRPHSYLVAGRIAVLEGLLRGTATSGLVARIPAQIRPRGGRLIFQQLHSNAPARVDVLPDGRVYLVNTIRSGSWLSLDGISYDVNGGDESPALLSGWQPYGSSYRAPRQTRVGDVCMLSGLARSGEWSKIISQMSGKGAQKGCLPKRRIIFGGPHHDRIQRLDLLPNPDGAVQHVPAAAVRHNWVSFDGMMWPAGYGKPINLNRRWTNYDNGYMRAAYAKVDDTMCVLSGLVKYRAGKWDAKHRVIAHLPVGCRPRRRLVHAANAHERQVRLDVLPSGSVVWITAASHGWVSLAGIRFVAYQ